MTSDTETLTIKKKQSNKLLLAPLSQNVKTQGSINDHFLFLGFLLIHKNCENLLYLFFVLNPYYMVCPLTILHTQTNWKVKVEDLLKCAFSFVANSKNVIDPDFSTSI